MVSVRPGLLQSGRSPRARDPRLDRRGRAGGNGHLSLAVVVALAVVRVTYCRPDMVRLGSMARRAGGEESGPARAGGRNPDPHRAQHAFSAHLGAFQLGARFLPELNAIASGLAGTTRTSITRFLCYGAASALTWAGRVDRARISSQPCGYGDCGPPGRPSDCPLPWRFRSLSSVQAGPSSSPDSRAPPGARRV